MIDYLTYHFSLNKEPLPSLSALLDEDAIKIMTELSDGTIFCERFTNPVQFLKERKDTE